MRSKTVWNEVYKRIPFEIQLHSVGMPSRESGIYCAYIVIVKDNLPKSFDSLLCKKSTNKYFDRNRWDYSALDRLFDFHGGITYYEVLRDEFTGKKYGVKVGCDYAHLYDDYVDSEPVVSDTKKSIETFLSHFPECLVWDKVDGKYRKFEQLKI